MVNTFDKNSSIYELETLAKDVLRLKQELVQRKPLVIEFCGTPKSGKTTTINALNIFLRRNEFRTAVIQEMAAVCPVKNKTHYFFNSWTLFSSLSETIKQLTLGENKIDIILIDRSVFDALSWFEWLNTNPDKNPHISPVQYEAFKSLLINTDMFTYYFDLIYIFKATPETALAREFAELLTEKRGSIMNEKVLEGFNYATDVVKEKYAKHFRKIETYDTSNHDANWVSYDVTRNILNVLKDLLTEKIGYFLDTMTISLKDGINDFDLIARREIFFNDRNVIEEEAYIQPVAIAVITNKSRNKVLVLKKNDKKTEKGSPEHKRLLLYLGGHMRIEDKKQDNASVIDILKCTLNRELKEELNESISITDNAPFLIYTPTNPKSKKHLAVCFIIEMDLDNKVFRPTSDEFIFKSPDSKSGTIMNIKELLNPNEPLETWSDEILKHVFNQKRTLFDL